MWSTVDVEFSPNKSSSTTFPAKIRVEQRRRTDENGIDPTSFSHFESVARRRATVGPAAPPARSAAAAASRSEKNTGEELTSVSVMEEKIEILRTTEAA
ncbi:hypothetical protein F2P81_004022 [Scophthalmus maximus]|uniref:Uncharacterized protein n=1 Tax=Scophthalmus maximus TaxID=52904 RepID=A0A6A4TBR4_SCOMX|nr:hypothetical protein F2P81_004022 [Scophthalmus maximus]